MTLNNAVRTLAAASLAVLATAPTTLAAQARCSKSGDVCTQVRGHDPDYVLRLNTFALRETVSLCVGANGGFDCKPFKLRNRAGTNVWFASVRWARRFPDLGPGQYRAVFMQAGRRIGPILSFDHATGDSRGRVNPTAGTRRSEQGERSEIAALLFDLAEWDVEALCEPCVG
jgi:hypothetical protein